MAGIEAIKAVELEVQKVSSQLDTVDGLDSLIIETMADKVSVLQSVKAEIKAALTDPTLTSDPAALAAVQAMLADYSLNIELYSKVSNSLLRHIDSLVKS